MKNICSYCGKVAQNICSRCDFDYYCSRNCQMLDFEHHRQLCFKLPPLISANDEQIVTHSNSESVFDFATSAKALNNENEKNAAQPMHEADMQQPKQPPAKTVEREAEAPVVDQQKKIDATNKTSTAVKEDKLPLAKKEDASKTFTPAFDVGAHTPAPNNFHQPPVTVKKQAKQTEEEVSTPISKFRRNQQIIQNEPKKDDKENCIFVSDLKRRSIGPGKAQVFLLNTCSSDENMLYVMEAIDGAEEYIEKIQSDVKEFTEKSKTPTGYKPIKDEMILAKFSDEYYRAVCKGVNESNGTYDVYFVDYGNFEKEQKAENFMAFPPKMKYDIMLISITVANMPKRLTKEHVKVLEDPNGFKVDVLQRNKEANIFTVKICDFD